jgi:DnaK suppressor protein
VQDETDVAKRKSPSAKKPKASKQKPATMARKAAASKSPARSVASAKPHAASAKAPAKSVKPLTVKSKGGKPVAPAKAPPKADAKAPAVKPPRQKSASAAEQAKAPRTLASVAATIKADAQGYVYVNGRRVRMISTKGAATVRKTRAKPEAQAQSSTAAQVAKPVKSRLQKKDLDEFRSLLLSKRSQLVGDLNAHEDQALQASGGDLSHMPIHMADIGTDTYDQDFMLGLAAKDRELIREIDDALRRIDDGSYGVCQFSGKPIPKARLHAKPWAKHTVEAARQFEQGRAQ